MKKTLAWTGTLLVAAVVTIAGAVGYHSHITYSDAGTTRLKVTENGDAETISGKSSVQQGKMPVSCDREALKRAFENRDNFQEISVRSLIEKFAETISDKRSQLALLRFRHFIRQHYPGEWEVMFRAIIEKAFPDHAAEILETLANMDRYNAWLEENRDLLAGMSYGDMKQALWDKRAETFGDDTEAVWAEASTVEQVRETIAILDESHGTALHEKMAVFKESVAEASGSDDGYLQSKKYNLTMAFLGMHSVQDELAGMDLENRAEALSVIRGEMGFTSAEMAAMEKRDAEHNARWEQGLAYMKERDRITGEYAGPELDEKLAELRQHHFNNGASTIEAEENSGFFRYTRRRVYGRN